MQRKYYRFQDWEDFNAGFYESKAGKFCPKAKGVLCSDSKFKKALDLVFSKWPISCHQNLSNTSKNRRAWLGQAACFLLSQCNRNDTKMTFKSLASDQQIRANEIATEYIKKYEERSVKIYTPLGVQMLLWRHAR